MMYADGTCPMASDGVTKLPCPDGYGKILASACCCALLEILLSFMKPSMLQKIFPPLVTGPVVMLIGVHLVESGFTDWVGGAGCQNSDTCTYGKFSAPWVMQNSLVWDFSLCINYFSGKIWGPHYEKLCVIFGLLIGCIVAAAAGYFSSDNVDAAPAASFMWVHTFKLTVYGPVVLPFLAVYIVLMMECIGDVTATSDVFVYQFLEKCMNQEFKVGFWVMVFVVFFNINDHDSNVSFAQNNGVISITNVLIEKLVIGAFFNCYGSIC